MLRAENQATLDRLHAKSPEISVRLLHVALVHFYLRKDDLPEDVRRELSRRRAPARDIPVTEAEPPSTEATRFAMARYLSDWLGQPSRCGQKICRRAKECRGDAPDCWRDEPPATPEEIEVAKGLWRYHLRKACIAHGGEDD